MVTCQNCAYFLKEFSICTSGFIMVVDPQEGCVSFGKEKIKDSPVKQLTANQFEFLKDTDFKMTWDKDGWLTDVGVRGLPRVQAMTPIPREPITFSYYDQKECGNLVYSRDPANPGVLVYTPLLDDQNFTFYKQWNANRFPPGVETKRIPAMAIPVHLFSLYEISHLIASRIKDGSSFNEKLHESLSADMLPLPPDLERTRQLWRSMGYPTGEANLPDGTRPVYFAYRRENARAVVFIQSESLLDVNIYEIAEALEIPVSREEETLGALRLSNRCILCGHVHQSPFDINRVCEFCLRPGSQIVFKPKTQKP